MKLLTSPTQAIRVLHVVKTLNLGGAEMNLLNLATAFDEQRVETHIAYSFGGELEENFRRAGLRLFKYALSSHRVRSPHTALIVCRIARYIRKHKINIVHTHNFNAHIWGLLAAKLAGVKLVEHVHDHRYTPVQELVRRQATYRHYRYIKYFRKRADRMVVLTKDQAAGVVAQDFCEPSRVIELQNGIPLACVLVEPREMTRDRLGIERDAFVVLSTSRIEPAKNIELFLRIAAVFKREEPRTVFLIAGAGPYLEHYIERSSELGLTANIKFVGFQSNIHELMAAADVYMAPTFLELHSIAILEAMKMRLPLLVSAGVGCHEEFIQHGKNGFLCDPFRDAPWITTLKCLMHDGDLRAAVASVAYATCTRLFDIRLTVTRFEQIYAELLSKASAKPHANVAA